MTRPASRNMRRPATWSTRLARAALIALVPLTVVAQVAFAHFPPISQTFRGGVTLTSFSGTFEVVWPSPVYVPGAVIELRDSVNNPLLQASDGAAVELDVPCTSMTMKSSGRCASRLTRTGSLPVQLLRRHRQRPQRLQ
jgi:hypothetical protein